MVCTRYIGIRTDAMNAISHIDYQFSTYTPHAQFIQMMSNPLFYKIGSKVLFCILNKRVTFISINNRNINVICYLLEIYYMYTVYYNINAEYFVFVTEYVSHHTHL